MVERQPDHTSSEPESQESVGLPLRPPYWLSSGAMIAIGWLFALRLLIHGVRVHSLVSIAEFAVSILVYLGVVFRRRFPSAVVVSVSLIMVFGLSNPLPAILVLYSTMTHAQRPLRFGLAYSPLVMGSFIVGTALHPHSGPAIVITVAIAGLLAAGAVAFGLYSSTRNEYVKSLGERAQQLQREGELISKSSRDEERLKIARELHDVVAHHITLISVMAEALSASGELTQVGSSRAAEIVHTMGNEARLALGELREILGVMRGGSQESETPRVPQPNIWDLSYLVDGLESSGISGSFRVEGDQRPLLRGTEIAIVRIAQEAITNVIRHAYATHAEITLVFTPNGVNLRIRDDGAGASPELPMGFGLSGMVERASLLGGALSWRTRPGDGFEVICELPDALPELSDAPRELQLGS